MDTRSIELENQRLKASWDCFPPEHLARYLGIEEQDQRINTHSILTRALLVDTLWPGKFDALIDEELRFGVVMTWLLQELRSGTSRNELWDELNTATPGGRIPGLVRQTADWLQMDACPLPDYLSDALLYTESDLPAWYLFEPALNTFAGIWKSQICGLSAEPIEVLEVACGSGNDYKAIHEFGLTTFINYSGFDICWKNIHNARDRFPEAGFFEASILNSGLPDDSFDYVFLHDVLGHLSPEGFQVAVSEIMRITRVEAWLHCFNVADIDQHEIHPFQTYFRNRLSIPRVIETVERSGAEVRVVPISGMLERKLGYVPDYTASSGTFIARKTPVQASSPGTTLPAAVSQLG